MSDHRFLAENVTESALAAALRDARVQWVYAESPAATALVWAETFPPAAAPLANWHHGRAFGETLEMAWWRQGDAYQVRTLATGSPPANPLGEADPEAAQYRPAAENHFLLVGERDEDRPAETPTWSAARVPQYLAYPVPGQPPPRRVALVVVPYRVGGMVRDQRFVRLTAGEVRDG